MREIRLFVSSTFRDMQMEREVLAKRAFPTLRRLAESRGGTFVDVDLRWGITDEQVAERGVLRVCLDEIARCDFFIGILGDRYGWTPGGTHRSITELEMAHGVLDDPRRCQNAFFYLRAGATTPLDEEPQRRAQLARLKERIRSRGVSVREGFRSPDELAELVIADLTRAFDRVLPEASPDVDAREDAAHDAYAAALTNDFVGREDEIHRLGAWANASRGLLVVTGARGVGKSALLARWIAPAGGERVIAHYVGASAASADASSLVARVVRKLDGGAAPARSDAEKLRGALAAAAAVAPVIVVLDGIDSLEEREGARALTFLPQRLPERVSLVVSAGDGAVLEELRRRGAAVATVSPIEEARRRGLVQERLARYGKALPADAVERIATSPSTGNPRFLRVLIDELRLHGEHESVRQEVERTLAAPDVASLVAMVLDRLERDCAGEHPTLVADLASLLWATRRGLREAELIDLCGAGVRRAAFSFVFHALLPHLVNRSGLYAFASEDARRAVECRYLADGSARSAVCLRIAAMLEKKLYGLQREHEAERVRWHEDLRETLAQLERAHAWPQLARLLTDPIFIALAWLGDRARVRHAWMALERATGQRPVDAYASVIAAPGTHAHARQIAQLLGALGYHAAAAAIQRSLIEKWSAPNFVPDGAFTFDLIPSTDIGLATLAGLAEEHADTLRLEGDLVGYAREAERAEALVAQLGLDARVLHLCLGRAHSAREEANWKDAAALYERAEELARRLHQPVALAAAIDGCAGVRFALGDLEGAVRFSSKAEDLLRRSGAAPAAVAANLHNRAMIHAAREESAEALACWIAAEEILRTSADDVDRVMLVRIVAARGERLAAIGRFDESVVALREARRLAVEIGDVALEALVTMALKAVEQRTEGGLAMTMGPACVHCGKTGDPVLLDPQHQIENRKKGERYVQCAACFKRMSELGYFAVMVAIAGYPEERRRKAMVPID